MNQIQSILYLSVILLFVSCSSGIDAKQEWAVYTNAMERSDFSTAANALNRILLVDDSNPSTYDSLAVLYFRSGMNLAAAATSEQGLALHETESLLKVSATSLKNLGDANGSLRAFIRFLELNPSDLNAPYEIAFAYINLEQFDLALKYIDLVVAHEKSATTAMTEVLSNTRQEVPYKAVAFNMQGFVFMQRAEYEKAAESYQKALTVFPDYQLAQNNLKFLVAQVSATPE